MSVPPTILGLIRKVNGLTLPGLLAVDGTGCEGSKFHSPSPLVVHEYRLSPDETVMLCGTCTCNLDVYLALLEAHSGTLPWEARREFGNLIRALGTRAWTAKETVGA